MAVSKNPDSIPPGREHFEQTQWSLVVLAGRKSSPGAAEALNSLCRTYWYPLYCYVRRKGYSPHDAQDLTQEFFARLLKSNSFATASREKGKFRTYLLSALNHFLSDEWDKARAAKRGGGEVLISLDQEDAEKRFQNEPCVDLSPDKVYDRRWALTVLREALNALRKEHEQPEKMRLFDLLKPHLTSEPDSASYHSIASELGMTPNAVAVAVHRLRQRYRELVRAAVAQTVTSPLEVDEELRNLFS
jgi:RNA polymerase sigma factor (sigma-70 family)